MDETVSPGDLTAPSVGVPLVPSGTEEQTATPAAPTESAVPAQRTVPYGALAEERARRKDLQRELQTTMEAQRKLQGRLDLLHELAQQPGSDAIVPPDLAPAETPSEPHSLTAAEAEEQAAAAFRTQVMHSVHAFSRAQPDFPAAYEHARQSRIAELMTLGYGPEEAAGITFDNEMEIIQNAYATGRNPAEVIYRYAAQRGFRGAPPAGGSAPTGFMTEADKVALAARGQASSKSLSAAGGGSTGTLTLEVLAGMSDAEFAEATKGDRWQRLLRS